MHWQFATAAIIYNFFLSKFWFCLFVEIIVTFVYTINWNIVVMIWVRHEYMLWCWYGVMVTFISVYLPDTFIQSEELRQVIHHKESNKTRSAHNTEFQNSTGINKQMRNKWMNESSQLDVRDCIFLLYLSPVRVDEHLNIHVLFWTQEFEFVWD